MPTPSQLAKGGKEHGEQVALFAWAAVAAHRGFSAANDEACYSKRDVAESYGTQDAILPLKWFHAIPNGGSRGDDEKTRAIRGGQLKAEGVKNGVFDTFWPCPRGRYAGLYIEMKRPALKPKNAGSSGGISDEQNEFGEYGHAQGYCMRVAWSWREAANIVEAYWKGEL